MKIPDAQVAVDKEWEKLEQLPSWQMTKEKSKREVVQGARKRANNCPFWYIDGYLSSQECGVRTVILEMKKPGCTPT